MENKDQEIKVVINGMLPAMTCEAYGHSELDFSLYHLLAASYFIKESDRIEKLSVTERITAATENAHRACILGGIMAIVASLEATINEFFLDAYGHHESWQKPLHDLMVNWKIIESPAPIADILRKRATLEKYQIACHALGVKQFIKGEPVYQNINYFIGLRNALMHYKPAWGDQQKIHAKLEETLNGKYPLNPFSKSGRFFPTKCLSHGCVSWGLNSCEIFIREFYEKVGQPHKYKFREIQLRSPV